MDAKEHLQSIKLQLDQDEKDLEQLDILIKVAEKAGENVLEQKRQQAQIRNRIKQWREALKSAGVV